VIYMVRARCQSSRVMDGFDDTSLDWSEARKRALMDAFGEEFFDRDKLASGARKKVPEDFWGADELSSVARQASKHRFAVHDGKESAYGEREDAWMTKQLSSTEQEGLWGQAGWGEAEPDEHDSAFLRRLGGGYDEQDGGSWNDGLWQSSEEQEDDSGSVAGGAQQKSVSLDLFRFAGGSSGKSSLARAAQADDAYVTVDADKDDFGSAGKALSSKEAKYGRLCERMDALLEGNYFYIFPP
jgi:hypothetical protein